jgi:hypothetical protein
MLCSSKRAMVPSLVAVGVALVLWHGIRAADDDSLLASPVPQDSLARWGEVPAWEGTFSAVWHMQQVRGGPHVGGSAVRTEDQVVNGTVRLDRQTNVGHPATKGSGGVRASIWHGSATASVQIQSLDIDRDKSARITRRDEGTGEGLVEADCDLQVDAVRGTFILHVRPLRIDMRYTTWRAGPPPVSSSRMGKDAVELSGAGMEGINGGAKLGTGRLPEAGLLLSHAATPDFTSNDGRVATETFSYTLRPVGSMPTADLVVESKAYDSWRPEAGLDERTIGNEITFEAKLQGPDGSPAKVKARKIIFELIDTSREPGVALNFPLAAANPGEFDLQFSRTSNPPDRYTVSGTGNQKAETVPGKYTSASIAVSSFDWGAWSTLKVTAELEDGRPPVVGHFRRKSGPADILLPKRAAGSKIADQWKQDNGVSSQPDLDDSETGPAGDSGKGDGFSLYEEYRGFYVNGEHIFGDPKKMDFFVRNDIGVDAEPGIILFTDLTGAEVHSTLLDSEFDRQNRVMNANRYQGPHVDPQTAGSFEQTQGQHGVFLETQAGLDGGLTVFSEAGVRGRPVIAMSVNLQPRNSLTSITTSENVPASDLAFAYDRAVAHELLHSVGAEEHGKGDGSETFFFVFADDPWNRTGKAHFRWNFTSRVEGGLGAQRPYDPMYDALAVTITDEATGRDLASMIEGDMMLARERLRPSFYPDLLRDAVPYVAGRQGMNTPYPLTAEQQAEAELNKETARKNAFTRYIGAEHGECSGAELCVMRYYFAKLYEKRDTKNAFYYISDSRSERAGLELCRSAAGTGINDKDRDKPQPRYGDAAAKRGACAASIIFNDALPLISDAIPTESRK